MAKEVLCPICGATYNLADDQIGRKVRCKKCEHAFTAGGEPKRRADDEDFDGPRVRSKRKKGRPRDEEDDKPKKTKSIDEQARARTQEAPGVPVSSFVILGVVVAVLFFCCGGGGVLWWAISSHKPTRPNNLPRRGQMFRDLPSPCAPLARRASEGQTLAGASG